MGSADYKSGFSSIKIFDSQKNKFDELRKDKTITDFFSELLEAYENPRPKKNNPQKEKKLTPYGPVIKHLRETLDRNYSSYAFALRISPKDLPKVESGEMELTTEQLRGLANRLNIYVEALEKGLVIPLPREVWR